MRASVWSCLSEMAVLAFCVVCSAAAQPMATPVTLEGKLGTWQPHPQVGASVTQQPDGGVLIETTVPEGNVGPVAYLRFAGAIVVTGASLLLCTEPAIPCVVRFQDRDRTEVEAVSEPADADAVGTGWRRLQVDFAEIPVLSQADREVGPLANILVCPGWENLPPGTDVRVEIRDLRLRPGEPVLAQPCPYLDERGVYWAAASVDVDATATDVVREGQSAVRLALSVGGPDGAQTALAAIARPPKEARWLGERLVFWCRPERSGYLPVTVRDKAGAQVNVVLDANDLTVGEWRRIEIPLSEARPPKGGSAVAFRALDSVTFDMGPEGQGSADGPREPGEYVWYIDDLHVEGEGPVALAATVGPVRDIGDGGTWSVKGDCTVTPADDVPLAGEGAVRVTVELGEELTSGGQALLGPADGQPWDGSVASFACHAERRSYLFVTATDSDGTEVSTVLSPRDVSGGKWCVRTLRCRELPNRGRGDDIMDNIASLSFGCYASWDGRKRLVPESVTAASFVIDDIHVSGESGVPVIPPPARRPGPKPVHDDTESAVEWMGHGRLVAEEERVVVYSGATSVRLRMQTREENRALSASACARILSPCRLAGLRMWLRAAQRGGMQLLAKDGERDTAIWYVGPERLRVGVWTAVDLRLTEARFLAREPGVPHIAPDELGPVEELWFVPLKTGEGAGAVPTWYIDTLELLDVK